MMLQERQCSCDVISRGVRVSIVALEKQFFFTFWVCVCGISYLACTSLHCRLWPVWPYRIFLTFLIRNTIFGEGGGFFLDIFLFIFFTIFVWNISNSTKNSARCFHKCKLHRSSCKITVGSHCIRVFIMMAWLWSFRLKHVVIFLNNITEM